MVMIVRQRGDGANGIVEDVVGARGKGHADHRIPMTVHKGPGRQALAEGEGLKSHRVVATGARLEVEEDDGGARDFIGKPAPHAEGDVKRQVLRGGGSHGAKAG